jgi:serine/threonine-protein kinase HipA
MQIVSRNYWKFLCEKFALTLNGKKRHLTRRMLVQYFGRERLGLESKVLDDCLQRFATDLKPWFSLIELSFLSSDLKAKYSHLVTTRAQILQLS